MSGWFGAEALYGAASADGNATVNPSGFGLTASLGTAAVSPYADVLVRVGSTAVVTAPLFTANVHPTGQSVTASLGTPTVAVSSSVSPAGYGLTAGLGTPGAGVDGGASPTGLSATAELGTPAVTVSSTVSPTTLAGTTALGTPTLLVDSGVSPTGQSATVSLGTPSEAVSSTVSPTGFGLTADLGTASASGGDNYTATPTGYELAAGLGTPTVDVVDGGAPPPATQGEPIGTKWQRRPVRPARLIQEPEVRQDAMVAVSGFAVSAQVGRTWQVADATIAPAGFQCYAQSNLAKAMGMHNPTDAQIVDWLIQALNQSV